MSDGFSIIVLFLLIGFAVVVEVLTRKGKLKRAENYSYQKVFREGLRWCLFVVIACLLIYMFTDSLEASLTIGIFLVLCVISGCLKILYTEYQIKKRGGQKA